MKFSGNHNVIQSQCFACAAQSEEKSLSSLLRWDAKDILIIWCYGAREKKLFTNFHKLAQYNKAMNPEWT